MARHFTSRIGAQEQGMFLCLLDIITMQSKHYEFSVAMSSSNNMHASYAQSAFNFTRVWQLNTLPLFAFKSA